MVKKQLPAAEEQKPELVPELKFLDLYFSAESPTRGNILESGKIANPTSKDHHRWGARVMDRYSNKNMSELLDAWGAPKYAVVRRLRDILITGKDSDAIVAARFILVAHGETTDKGAETTSNVFQGPTIIYQGDIPDSMRNKKKREKVDEQESVSTEHALDAGGHQEAGIEEGGRAGGGAPGHPESSGGTGEGG